MCTYIPMYINTCTNIPTYLHTSIPPYLNLRMLIYCKETLNDFVGVTYMLKMMLHYLTTMLTKSMTSLSALTLKIKDVMWELN